MTAPMQDTPPARGLSAHILPTSATMIGACMTVLTIGHLGHTTHARLAVDKLLAIDALVFLASAVLSFMSIRAGAPGVRHERRAELLFLFGLAGLAIGAVALAFAIN